MKAKFGKQKQNAMNHGVKKETVAQFRAVSFRDGEFHEPAKLVLYTGRSRGASVVYASLWVHGDNFHTSGAGRAGGYGYCKYSAAAGAAIRSAGIELTGDVYGRAKDEDEPASIDGVGESAIRAALLAISAALGYEKVKIFS